MLPQVGYRLSSRFCSMMYAQLSGMPLAKISNSLILKQSSFRYSPMIDLLPRRAPRTLRDFLLRVAAIAVAALIVLGAIGLFEHFLGPSSTRPVPSPSGTPHPSMSDSPDPAP
jgi:hypothetical protein